MKLLRVKASNFKNCQDDTVIDLVAKSKKTTEDKEYELQEIAEGLYVYSIGAFIGKNASGKTTALELLDCCYDILGKFSLENKHYSYEGIKLEIIFFHEGTIVPNGDDLLMAFAKLDDKGKGRFFSRDEYLRCLDFLWRELENHYSEKDVCVPILGAGTTSFDGGSGASISQQDLLDIMIWSYKLSSHKIKAPHRLRIICKKNRGFSINNIDK